MATALRVGTDLVAIRDIAASIREFGDRYVTRIFTEAEVASCLANPTVPLAARLAARFAAKEAVVKSLRPPEPWMAWRDIEIRRHPGGWCDVALSGQAAALARESGLSEFAVSMSHDVEYATAVVVAQGAADGNQ